MAVNQQHKSEVESRIAKTGFAKKAWRIHSKEGGSLSFNPIFEPNPENGEIEATKIGLKFESEDARGNRTTKEMTFNWLDIYMFIYFTCNEELRLQLANRYDRNVSMIPYDVTITPTPDEMAARLIRRRVELPVDELVMAIARNEAFKMVMKNPGRKPGEYVYRRPRGS